jgi:homoserine kinase
MDEIKVSAPATVSNVVCGFDCLGFALGDPADAMTLRKTDEPAIRIIHRDRYGLPTDPLKNVAGVALQALMDAAKVDFGFELQITKGIKPGSGVGSSAASACGAVVAANRLLGNPFSNAELVDLAMAGELLASGSRHADNLAPCIYGGFVLVRSSDPVDIVPLECPALFATVLHPQIEIKTSEARAMLPRQVPLSSAVRNWSNLGAFVAALSSGDLDLMARSLEDTIVEPVRKTLIPRFDEVKAAAMSAGAIGGGISGSGPSVFFLSENQAIAATIDRAVSDIYSPTGIEFVTYVSPVGREGVRIDHP